jgi:hypothetical protein
MAEIDKNKPYSIMNNFLYNSNQPLDAKYGPYSSLEEALERLPLGKYNENLEEELTGLRYIGLTFGVLENGKITEYWFEKDINKPVLKYPIENTGGNGLPDGYYIATFDINNDSVNTKFNSIITDNEGYIKLPEVSDLSNQRFLGWSSTPNGDVIQDYPKITNNIIYYGKWEKVQKITWYEGKGVTITVKVDSVNITNNSNVVVGSKVEVSKTDINSHYPFINWNITGGVNISSNETTVTFDMPESDVNIQVIEGADEHKVSINQNDKGVIKYNDNTITFESGVYYETVGCRTDIKLNTTPNLGYSFKNWVINDKNNTTQDLTYQITDDTIISVNYYKQGILIKGAISTTSQLGTVLQDKTKRDSINYDSTVTRTFVPYLNNNYNTSGYTFLIHENDVLNINHFKDSLGSYNYNISTADINTIVIPNSGVIPENTSVLYQGIFDGTVGNNPIGTYEYNNITYRVYVYYCGNKFQEISYTITNN